jgi:hypothetical protein
MKVERLERESREFAREPLPLVGGQNVSVIAEPLRQPGGAANRSASAESEEGRTRRRFGAVIRDG